MGRIITSTKLYKTHCFALSCADFLHHFCPFPTPNIHSLTQPHSLTATNRSGNVRSVCVATWLRSPVVLLHSPSKTVSKDSGRTIDFLPLPAVPTLHTSFQHTEKSTHSHTLLSHAHTQPLACFLYLARSLCFTSTFLLLILLYRVLHSAGSSAAHCLLTCSEKTLLNFLFLAHSLALSRSRSRDLSFVSHTPAGPFPPCGKGTFSRVVLSSAPQALPWKFLLRMTAPSAIRSSTTAFGEPFRLRRTHAHTHRSAPCFVLHVAHAHQPASQ